VGADWLAPVSECRQSSRELSCINTACVCYMVSVRPRSLLICLTVGGSHSGKTVLQVL
jgi:hypothetical protein